MSIKSKFDAEKALEVLLYIAKRVPDMYHALKVLYFADKEHLAKYGRLICGDSYIAMEKGPVPSGTYDIIKHARGDRFCSVNIPIKESIALRGNNIVPLREVSLDFLSESEVECLDAAIEQYGHLPFGEIKNLSHDDAFKLADENDQIPLEAIVKNLPDGELILDYIANG